MKPNTHFISSKPLSIKTISKIIQHQVLLDLSESAKQKVLDCRQYLDNLPTSSAHYGINTGFGSLCNTIIDQKDLAKLQVNLVSSHACGVGRVIPEKLSKIMLLLKIQSLAYGHSGVSLETVQRLIDFFNYDVIPVVFEKGSLGASGDLAPLSHLSLPLIGLGEVWYQNEIRPAAEVLEILDWKPIEFQSKEGLALINGTQFMSAYGVAILIEAKKLMKLANKIAAMSIEAFDARIEPFLPQSHRIRPHEGQVKTAKYVRGLLKNSEIMRQEKKHVQDPYSFRCVPQVHGASRDAVQYVKKIFTQEINSVTDNPNIFPLENKILSAGNFHGQPLALGLDHLALALSELGSISERRVFQLISGSRGLPPFLAKNAGLNSGFMIPQYTAAALASQNKQLCTPTSADSIVSSNGQEDHVSMGANGAIRTYQVLENLKNILAIELMTAAQAIEFRRPLRSSEAVEDMLATYRQHVPFLEEDTFMQPLIQKTVQVLDILAKEN
jgi:histidine ammonia-lyase